jgi:hypothetical protein
MTTRTKAAVIGERLPYLVSNAKAPGVLERPAATKAQACEEDRPYERSSRRCSRPRCSGAPPSPSDPGQVESVVRDGG